MPDKVEHHREGTSEALVVKYQRGDRAALAVLVRRHSRALFSTAFYIVGSSEVASRLTMEVFQTLMEQAGSFHIEMQFRTWVFAFLHQKIGDYFNLSDRSLEAQQSPPPSAPDNTAAASTSRLGRSQLVSRRVTECVSGLPLQLREVVALKLVGQLTIPELAIVTQLSEDQVRALLRQTLERIRDAISDTEDYARALR